MYNAFPKLGIIRLFDLVRHELTLVGFGIWDFGRNGMSGLAGAFGFGQCAGLRLRLRLSFPGLIA